MNLIFPTLFFVENGDLNEAILSIAHITYNVISQLMHSYTILRLTTQTLLNGLNNLICFPGIGTRSFRVSFPWGECNSLLAVAIIVP
jgi:hypothetical protein